MAIVPKHLFNVNEDSVKYLVQIDFFRSRIYDSDITDYMRKSEK
ncbi:hypothetical protein [Agathobacter ruminis]|nr:hypothetical protein [Agathobacter ruminis]